MSSKIKVDTIENVAGSGNVSLGSGHNLVVPGNTSISGDLTMGHDGAIINFGADSDITLTHNHNTGLTLTGTGHTFSSDTYNVIKIQTDSNDDGSNDDAILQWTNGSSNTVKGEIRYDESESMFEIGAGDNQGHIKIDANGHITKPLQSAFLVTKNAAQTGITVNQNVLITFDTERFDQNGDFSSNTFTAPVTGRYQLNALIYTSDAPTDLHYFTIRIITSNRDYYAIFDPGQAGLSGANAYHTLGISVLADMDASDTAYVNCYTPSGTSQTNIDGSHATSFSGFLAC